MAQNREMSMIDEPGWSGVVRNDEHLNNKKTPGQTLPSALFTNRSESPQPVLPAAMLHVMMRLNP
jgi:hypothetical protein